MITAPELDYPGDLLSAVHTTVKLKPLHPPASMFDHITSLRLTHCQKATDTAIAGLLYKLPQLESLNLKGCTLAGKETLAIILERLAKLKRINLKGVTVETTYLTDLIDRLHTRLVVLKADKVTHKVRYSFGMGGRGCIVGSPPPDHRMLSVNRH